MANKDSKANKKEENKNKKSFFKSFKAELKKVTWPTPKQLVNNTVAVITIVLITAVIVFVLDLAFETINKHGVEKIKETLYSTNVVSENEDNQNKTEENVTEEDITIENNNEENVVNNAE